MHPENLTPLVIAGAACAGAVVWIVVYLVVTVRERNKEERAALAKARVLGMSHEPRPEGW
jgi:hypothetical protein